jgi:heat shock protein HtpX
METSCLDPQVPSNPQASGPFTTFWIIVTRSHFSKQLPKIIKYLFQFDITVARTHSEEKILERGQFSLRTRKKRTEEMKNSIKTIFFLTLFALLLMAVGGWLGGQQGLILGFGFSLFTNALAYWFSDKIVLAMYRATPVSENHPLFETVRQLAHRAHLPVPRVYLLPIEGFNAFATGRNPKHAAVAITQGLYDQLNQQELEGVIAHELAHIKNYDTLIMVIAATLASTLMFLINMAKWAAIFGVGRQGDDRGPGFLEILALSIIGPIAALMIQSAISRSREFIADAAGSKMAGGPHGLANALVKLERLNRRIPHDTASPQTAHLFIVNPLSSNLLIKLFSTHPPVQERIRALVGETQARAMFGAMR